MAAKNLKILEKMTLIVSLDLGKGTCARKLYGPKLGNFPSKLGRLRRDFSF